MEGQVVTWSAPADDPCTSRFTHESAQNGTAHQLTPLRSTHCRPASPWVVASRYKVIELLGRGGVGEVWLAEDTVLGRDVALKRLTGAPREPGVSALREARVLAQLRHPGIVQIHDIVRDPIAGHPAQRDIEWIVMEALPGHALSAVLRQRGRLPVEQVLAIGARLNSALRCVHAAGLTHRDVKPANVMLTPGGRTVLTDFGLSSAPVSSVPAGAGLVSGSLGYLAPETISGGQFGPPSDMYALGVTLFEAVEGRRPYGHAVSSSPRDGLSRRADGDPPHFRHAAGLTTTLAGLLEREPGSRLTADELADQIARLAGARSTRRSAATAAMPTAWSCPSRSLHSPSAPDSTT